MGGGCAGKAFVSGVCGEGAELSRRRRSPS